MLMRMWRNWNSCVLIVGIYSGAVTMENSMEVPQKKITELPHNLPNLPILLLAIHPNEVKVGTQADICIPTFSAALFKINKRWKQHKCSLTSESINKMWYAHVIRRKETLTHATTWLILKD
jgi:hypothetical protein